MIEITFWIDSDSAKGLASKEASGLIFSVQTFREVEFTFATRCSVSSVFLITILMTVQFLDREFTAKQVQAILRSLTGGTERIGLALLNYYARTNLVPTTGKTTSRGRSKYSYCDLVLLCWLFRMKREGLPVNRFRRGIDYLRKRLPKLYKSPADMVLLTDGRQLFIKHRVQDKGQIAEVLTGRKAGQYVWAYAIGSLIEEIDRIITDQETAEATSDQGKVAA